MTEGFDRYNFSQSSYKPEYVGYIRILGAPTLRLTRRILCLFRKNYFGPFMQEYMYVYFHFHMIIHYIHSDQKTADMSTVSLLNQQLLSFV